MAFVVETGSGSSTSNSYAAVADADSYLSDRGIAGTWAADTAAKQVALIKASDFLDAAFRFNGGRVSDSQAMAWPRQGASDTVENISIGSTTIPAAIKRACMELAYKSAQGTVLNPDLARGGLYSSVKLGSLQVVYPDGSPARTIFGIESLIKGLLRQSPLDGRVTVPDNCADVASAFTRNQMDYQTGDEE